MSELSIIIATFNSDKTLKKTLNSMVNQTNKDFELIIIDGKSLDNTLKIIESFKEIFSKNKISFTYISEPDTGIYNAWNKGVKLAKGNWISFIGSDDEYVDDAIAIYKNKIEDLSYENIDLIYSNVKYVEGNKELRTINGIWSWNIFKRYMNIAHVGSFHSKNYFETYGMFDESYKICGDYELLLRARNNLKTLKIDKITAIMQAGGISNSQIKNVFLETYKAKCTAGGINSTSAKRAYYLAFFKYYMRQMRYGMK